ncbi:uroporphyrinogen-III C-methyltransferase [Fusibacter sp. 3D3]|uniref:uroporphyrinogen-III C-methyltransferase n=1 Tax=Fusibacter sp. 3D3 TaxID=1048380 RepID=UPI000853790F|nr:uroporphyrinogen-III C-methyltransferase [Fusibacter sp. 3D3]GAU76886.1 uroporphyrinogen-III methyltransferase [Fusibacter sp. 3D3]
MNSKYAIGTVYLVGAGPGDIGLLTNKGLALLKSCDCLVYDRLIQDEMLALAPASCEKVYVGKAASDHAMPQEQINLLLCEKAKHFKTVVRLKGGDPYVFGRGGEEGEVLRAHNVPFEVVPGISSSIGGLAYAGIPITHRHHASSFHVFTGHFKDDSKDHDWSVVAKIEGTLVFLMSIGSIPYITSQLIQFGKKASTPIAVVSNAASSSQQVFESTLEKALDELPIGKIKSPALLVVGEVIHMRETLNWFESKPLFGKKIAVTRATAQSSHFSAMLRAQGASVIELPMISIESLPTLLQQDHLMQSTQIWFTSENGVHEFMKSLWALHLDSRALFKHKILAIGPTTSKCLEQYGIRPDFVPVRYTQEGIIELMETQLSASDHVLIPGAQVMRSLLTDWLAKICSYEKLTVYQTIRPEYSADELSSILKKIETLDYVTFASGSAVQHFHEFLKQYEVSLSADVKFASIGPVTSSTLEELGYPVHLSANPHTLDTLLKVLMADAK